MKFITKKRVVLFLLFIFPLICFLILSTGENNFIKLPVVTESVLDITKIDSNKSKQFKDHITIVCFLGNDISVTKTGLLNLNEKVYKKFIDYKKFQVIALYPKGKEVEAKNLKKELSSFTDLSKWFLLSATEEETKAIYDSFGSKDSLVNLGSTKAYLIDKDVSLRGRTKDEDAIDGMLYGYNLNSISELNGKLKDDVNVLFYEYYAAFKNRNKNKANRKEVGK